MAVVLSIIQNKFFALPSGENNFLKKKYVSQIKIITLKARAPYSTLQRFPMVNSILYIDKIFLKNVDSYQRVLRVTLIDLCCCF